MKTIQQLKRDQIEARLDGLLYNLSIAKDKFPEMYAAYIPVWEFEVVVYELALKGLDTAQPSAMAPLTATQVIRQIDDFWMEWIKEHPEGSNYVTGFERNLVRRLSFTVSDDRTDTKEKS